MKAIKTYPTRVEADLARIALDAAGMPSVVVGIGVEHGRRSGRRAVARRRTDHIEAALRVLEDA